MSHSELDGFHNLLHHHWTLGNWPRLEEKSRELLSRFPNDFYANQTLAIALLRLEKTSEAARPTRTLLELDPNASWSHVVASRYWLQTDYPARAYWHGRRAMELAPTEGNGFMRAGLALCVMGRTDAGLRLLRQARDLEIDNPTFAETEIRMRAIYQRSLDHHIGQKVELHEILARNPASKTAHELLGDFHAGDFGNPRQAIEHYRSALARDPLDEDCQKKLVAPIPVQNVLTRTLFLPSIVGRLMWNHMRKAPCAYWFLFLFLFQITMGILCWLAVTGLLFGVPAKCYELFFLSDTSLMSVKSEPVRRFMLTANRIPFWIRVLLVLGLWLGFWVVVLGICGLGPILALSTVGALFGAHFTAVCLWVGAKRLEKMLAERRVRRSLWKRTTRLVIFALVCNAILVPGMVVLAASFPESGLVVLPLLSLLVVNAAIILGAFDIVKDWFRNRSEDNAELPPPGKAPPMPPVFGSR